MNEIIIAQTAAKTMSSREIARLCDKEHRNVCRDIENLNKTYLSLGMLTIEQGYYTHENTGDQRHREFFLTKEQSIDLITGYRADLRIKINRRWAELEQQVAQNTIALPDFSDPVAAARAWADEVEAKQLAMKQIAVLEPKAHALDTIADTENTYTLRECAKTIGIREKDLVNLLLKKKWCYRDAAKKLQPHADKVTSGVFINRASPVVRNQLDGQERVFLHMRVTAFGLTRITGLVNKQRGVAA